ncbi:MAG TPA: hypothetical protein VHZ98_16415 [Galbitalea sp.]|jgi:hypothetical protein|nr:hypothetical protein [Galbitalea sp.]
MGQPRSRYQYTVEMTIPEELEVEFNQWYEHEHVADMLNYPGVISVRRYRRIGDAARYLAVYEIDAPEVILSPDYLQREVSEWTRRLAPSWIDIERGVWAREITEND